MQPDPIYLGTSCIIMFLFLIYTVVDAYSPLDHHKVLRNEIKAQLSKIPFTNTSLIWRIELPFDQLAFYGGLGRVGDIYKDPGHSPSELYKIHSYNQLRFLLGPFWHVKVLHYHKDPSDVTFLYINLESVKYYLKKGFSIVEEYPDSIFLSKKTDTLVFEFTKLVGLGYEKWQSII